MKGLLYKDLLTLQYQGKFYLIMLALWLAISIVQKSPLFFAGAMGIMSVMLPINCFAYDEKVGWDKFALTMPVSRFDVVLSKYLLTLIFPAVTTVISILLFMFSENTLSEGLAYSMAIFGIALFIAAVYLPLVFKFGVEKGRTLIIAVVCVPSILIMIVGQLNFNISGDLINTLVKMLPLAAVLLYFLSIILAYRIYKKKEL